MRNLKRSVDWNPQTEKDIRDMEKLLLHRQWRIYLDRDNLSGVRVREAIVPVFQQWIDHDIYRSWMLWRLSLPNR